MKKLFMVSVVLALAVSTVIAKPSKKKVEAEGEEQVYEVHKKDSDDGGYNHVTGCDYLGKSYHKILDKKILQKYQKEGIDELYLVFANRNVIYNSSVKVSIKYVYYKDGEASASADESAE
ncbi:MAG: hypothetical protein K6B17_07235 [Treponema sp.]|nr:hypothetical protein [Treponema sp.]